MSEIDLEAINLAEHNKESRRIIEPLKAEAERLRARVKELEGKIGLIHSMAVQASTRGKDLSPDTVLMEIEK